jgi:CRP-like cAMP-binding protein
MQDTVAMLKSVAIFQNLDDGELARVAEVCRTKEFVSGEYIFKEGEAGSRLYLIVEGDVRISRVVPGERRGSARGAQARRALRRDVGVRPLRAVHRRDLQRRHQGADDLAQRLRALARLQSGDRVQGAVELHAPALGRLRATNDSLRSFLAMSMF